jgi:multiple sugar transport system permease protein
LLVSLIISPMVISEAVVGLMRRYILDPSFGILNYSLTFLGIPMGTMAWLGQPTPALFTIIFTEVWRNTPFIVLILFAGLRSLPVEPFECARIDGAGRWRLFRDLTLPLLLPAILIALVFRTVFVLRSFGLIFVMTGGGPGDATMVLAIDIYRNMFKYYDVGAAAVLSVVMLAISIVASLGFVRLMYSRMFSREV